MLGSQGTFPEIRGTFWDGSLLGTPTLGNYQMGLMTCCSGIHIKAATGCPCKPEACLVLSSVGQGAERKTSITKRSSVSATFNS